MPKAKEEPTVCYSGAPSSPRVRCVNPHGEAQRTSGEDGTTVTFDTLNVEQVMGTRHFVRPSLVAISAPTSTLPGFVREGYVKGIMNAHERNAWRARRPNRQKPRETPRTTREEPGTSGESAAIGGRKTRTAPVRKRRKMNLRIDSKLDSARTNATAPSFTTAPATTPKPRARTASLAE